MKNQVDKIKEYKKGRNADPVSAGGETRWRTINILSNQQNAQFSKIVNGFKAIKFKSQQWII